MSLIFLPPRASQLIAVTLLIFILSLPLWLFLVPLFGLYSDMVDSRANLEFQLERNKRLVSKLPYWKEQVNQVRSGADPDKALWKAETASLAAAAIQTLVLQSAAVYQVQVNMAQTLPSMMDQEYEKISVVVDLQSSLGSIQQLLYAIESHMPALYIQNLTIRSQNTGGTQIDAPIEPTLDIRVEITGYRLTLKR
ncbi:type II secretion system protein GspM [Paraglaciecola sp.]|uniref:type II secretion system protein GspM n=1 Tax=Paraglaciecola sp. TaxID=1920173 RepID=UPI0030F37BC5